METKYNKQVYIGNSITEIIIILMATVMLFCSCSKDDVLRLKEEGYVSVKGIIMTPKDVDPASKDDVPECSIEQPVGMYIRLLDVNGFAFISTSNIAFDGVTASATDQIVFPVGNYIVDAISLVDANDNITHTVPHLTDSRFEFYRFVTNPLPFNITISAGNTTPIDADIMCYTEETIDLGNFTIDLTVTETETLFFIIDNVNCLASVQVEVDFRVVYDEPVTHTGLHSIPIPKDHTDYRVSGFDNVGNMRQSFLSNISYDKRVFLFRSNCN